MITKTPPMGWTSEKAFGADINETLIKETADALSQSGLRDLGYEYLIVDDGWMTGERDADGNIIADAEKFPSGMKALADYVHSKGLKFGLYSVPQWVNDRLIPSSFDTEFQDAALFASWGVDYIKYDCNTDSEENIAHNIPRAALYNRMSMAIRATGREMLLAACNRGDEHVPKQIYATGADTYRYAWGTSRDYTRFMKIAKEYYECGTPSVPGCISEIDTLNVGLDIFTEEQQSLQFAALCFFQSPLFISCDVRTLSESALAILSNRELIALDQDAECRPPYRVQKNLETYSFFRHLENGEYAIAFFNFGTEKVHIPCEFYRFGIHETTGVKFNMTDVVSGEQILDRDDGWGEDPDAYTFKIYRMKVSESPQ